MKDQDVMAFTPKITGGSCKSSHPILKFNGGASGAPAMLVQVIRSSSEPQQMGLILSKLPKELRGLGGIQVTG